jgi:hypothetical protein
VRQAARRKEPMSVRSAGSGEVSSIFKDGRGNVMLQSLMLGGRWNQTIAVSVVMAPVLDGCYWRLALRVKLLHP